MKKLIAIIHTHIVWTDCGNRREGHTYYLYESKFFKTRSYKALGFSFKHMIKEGWCFRHIVEPWLAGLPLDTKEMSKDENGVWILND